MHIWMITHYDGSGVIVREYLVSRGIKCLRLTRGSIGEYTEHAEYALLLQGTGSSNSYVQVGIAEEI
ncbi:hypothetical protein QBC32DRAFT_346537 [Pseudoneurospora amorphoporcata]|uniref:Uncharacterized protein n=1 Tax=Pseudoneurospora amorphoporcata TaxID=241081 RepID=A0AAN6NUJ3_9PEZI|nr:hypothetical protein QBC32DRAFT_346537 [Pseudoneurospora amorphoporcata]